MDSQESFVSFEIYWQILQRRWLPALAIFTFVYILSVFGLSVVREPNYQAVGKLLFKRTNTVSALTGVGTELGKLEPVVGDRSNPLNTESEVITSVPVVQNTIERLDLQDNQGGPLRFKDFLKRLTVKELTGSDVLEVSYKDRNPQIAAEVVNNLMQIYLERNVNFHRLTAQSARKFIEKQLPAAELVVRNAEVKLRQFKEKNQVIALQIEANRGVEMITNLQRQIGEVQGRIADVEAQSRVIRDQLRMNAQQGVITTSLSQSRGVQDALTQVQELETKLATRRSVLQDNHPEIIRLQNNLTALRGILQSRIQQVTGTRQTQIQQNLQNGELQQHLTSRLVELKSTHEGLNNQLLTLSRLKANYKQQLNRLPKLEQQQRELERKQQAAQSTYSLLLQKLQETRIAENQNLGNARQISQALVPDEPASSPMLSYMGAGLLGILAALATVYALEITDKSVRTIDDIRELFGFTILGVIPCFSKEQKLIFGREESQFAHQRLIVNYAPGSLISEAYRMLRANLTFVSSDKELKTIVVTSSVPQEGKSTVSANLALVMARMGRKVLLVDGDLRRPVQHHIWELPNREGLSHVIVGQSQVRTTIAKVSDNLDVLTAGVVPPSPASLLDSKRMATLIHDFAIDYDFVIIDAPALTVAADAAILGQVADGMLLVVRPGVVNSVDATIARDILQQSGQNVLGQVVNGVITQNEPRHYYYTEEESAQETSLQKEMVSSGFGDFPDRSRVSRVSRERRRI
ncbi:MAG: polysaccharide biosynthesis tyrosine autokinase [Calothrix sp. MO_167.B12]|nr:polysaccharide biosynthesis tyrosine autokinase [Calothrix sp. MO_167.B12]